MKIALITNYWINSDGGGVREYSKNLVKAFKNYDNIDTIVLFREGYDVENYRLPLNKINFILKALKILKFEKPDAIICQGGWYAMVPAIIYNNAKLFYIFHTHADKRLSPLAIIFYNFFFKKFDKIGFVSQGLEENIVKIAGLKIPINKTVILYAGIEVSYPLEKEINDFKEKFNLSRKYLYLLGLGLTALHAKKEGAKLLMRTLKKVILKHPEVKLILTRKGVYEEELKNYSKQLKISDRVIFTGDLQNPNVAIAFCDIYAHITYNEGGLSLSILEAMAFGKPVIASAVGGIPEAIDNGITGILVNNDIDEIYGAIIKFIENKELAEELGGNAQKKVKEKFAWKNTTRNFRDFLMSSSQGEKTIEIVLEKFKSIC